MPENPKSFGTAEIKKLPGSRVEITGSIPAPEWEKHREKALKNLKEDVKVDGFRKGMVPENVLVAKIGESIVNEETAELALSRTYIDILIDNKIDAIGKPQVVITKLARGNPLEFRITTDVVPEVKLPDYKKLAESEVEKSSKDKITVTDKDVDEAKEKMRIRIADAISEKTEIELPEVMIESELDRTQAQFEGDIEKMGVKMDDYLKHAKKTLEEIRREWRPHAEKKAKLQLILNAIATAENIKPDQKEIDAEVNHIIEHYKDADRERAAIYAETVLTNEKVFEFLETTGQ